MNKLRLAMVMVVVSLLSGLVPGGASVSAQEGGFTHDNPLITQLVNAGLVTPVNHEEVVNGVETTIDWVYADASQIIVCLTMYNLDFGATDPGAIPAKEQLRVVGPSGDEFQLYTASATSTDAADGRFNLTIVSHFYPQARMLMPLEPGESRQNFFVELGADLPATLDVELKLDVEPNAKAGSLHLAMPGDPAELTLPVTVALQPGITLTPATTLTVNDQDITLQRLTIAPSQTLAEVCYTAPDTEDWQPVARLFVGDSFVLPRSHSNRPTLAPLTDGDARCVEMPFDVVQPDGLSTVDFQVEFLFASPANPAEYWENVNADLASEGIELELYPVQGTYYAVTTAPADISDEGVYQLIRQARLAQTPVVEGPWAFTLDIPQAD